MRQRGLHHVTGRLSLRAPQAQSLTRLVRGLNGLRKVLSLGVCRTFGAYGCVGCVRADEGKVR